MSARVVCNKGALVYAYVMEDKWGTHVYTGILQGTLVDAGIHKGPFDTKYPGEADSGSILKMPLRFLMTCTSPHSLSY